MQILFFLDKNEKQQNAFIDVLLQPETQTGFKRKSIKKIVLWSD